MDGSVIGAARPRVEWRLQSPFRLRLRRLARVADPVLLSVLLTVTASAVFVLFPSIDLWVSAALHDPAQGFVAAAEPGLRLLRRSSTWVMGGLILWALVLAAVTVFRRRDRGRSPAIACARRPLCLLVVFAVGPGLLVNGVLKALWGRARPVDVFDFGGDRPFSPAWAFSQACADNCSFTSGEGASAAWMATALLLIPAPWRAIAAPPLLAYALMLSLNRVAFGGHFLSDVVLSWCLTGLVAAVAWRLMVASPAAGRARRTRRPGLGRGSVLAFS